MAELTFEPSDVDRRDQSYRPEDLRDEKDHRRS